MQRKVTPYLAVLAIAAALTVAPSAVGSAAAPGDPGSGRVTWDDFQHGFDHTGDDAKWALSPTGSLPDGDGRPTTSPDGLQVVPTGTNAKTGKPAFAYTTGKETDGGQGAYDHVKWYALTNHQSSAGFKGFDAQGGRVLTFDTTMSARTFGPRDLWETVDLIEAEGGTADAIIADVTHGMDVIRLVKSAVERHGGLHIAFNNACLVGEPKPLAEMCEAVRGETLSSNLTGVRLLMKHEIAHMRGNGGGVIINNSTNISVFEGRVGFGAYAASKAALSALTRTAAQEHIADGIRINAISPGYVAAAEARVAVAAPSGQMAEDGEIAAAVVWPAGPESQFVVGHDLVLDGAVAA